MMTIRSTVPSFNDAAVRAYLLALKAGQKPDERPEVGPAWSPVVDSIEQVYVKSHGDTVVMERALDALSKKYPDLVDLLAAPSPTLARVEQVTELGSPQLPESVRLPDELRRGASPLLEQYSAYSKRVSPEGYEDFHPSCFIWMLSVIAARRVCIPFSQKQYTPLMIALTARTSLFAKSTTAEVAITVLQAAGLRWLLGSDETTPQKLLSDMTGKYVPKNFADLDFDQQERLKLRLSMAAQRGWYYDEFGQLVKQMMRQNGVMSDFRGLLLKLDNCSDQYEYSTHSRGTELIEKPYLALLASMTPAHIKNNAKSGSEFWSDGFWARFVFVTPPQGEHKDAPFALMDSQVPASLFNPLRAWHERLGVPQVNISMTEDSKGRMDDIRVDRDPLPETTCIFGDGVYEAWVAYRSALKLMVKDWRNEDLDGSYNRLSMKAIRVAALIASLENNNRIEMCHWALAQHIAERWRVSLHELYSQVNTAHESETASLEDEIIRHLRRLANKGEPPPTINILRTSYMKNHSHAVIEEKLRGLVRANVVEAIKTSHSTRYRLLGEE